MPAAAAKAAPKPEPKGIGERSDAVLRTAKPQLHPGRFALAEHKRNVYFITPADGTTLEEVLDPIYWSHVAARFRPTDRVEVHAEDGTFFAELFVREAGRQHATLVPLRVIEFEKLKQAPDPSGFAVQWKGPHLRWCVVRLATTRSSRASVARATRPCSGLRRTTGAESPCRSSSATTARWAGSASASSQA